MSEAVTLWRQGAFTVTATGLNVDGRPTEASWASLGVALAHVRSGVAWALGDWLLYAEERGWAEEAVTAAMEATGLKLGTLMNLKAIARRFPKPERRQDLPWSHHALVSSLEGDEAQALLARSREQAWGWEELRAHAREVRHETRRRSQAWPADTFPVILAEPPWPRFIGQSETVNGEQLAALAPRVQAIAAPACVCYLRVPPSHVEDGLTVLRAWGFRLRSQLVVLGDTPPQGEHNPFVRERHEWLLVGTRGEAVPPEENLRHDSVVTPETLRGRVCHAYPDAVPKVLLFENEPEPGWTTWGHAVVDAAPRARAVRVREEAAVPA